MPRFLPLLLPIALVLGSCERKGTVEKPVVDPEVISEDVDLTVKALAKELKQELLAALADGGTAQAIGVCRDKAPEVTARHAAEHPGWTIRRTALRVRNPANAPDDWERKQLEQFARLLSTGVNPATLTKFEVHGNGARFARAIPTGAECLLCHGPAVDAETRAAIDRLYPDDQATGFQLGELRGMFSVKVPLE